MFPLLLNVLLQVVLLLIERGAEIDPQDVQGNTPLHFASQNGHMESTTLLLIVSHLYILWYISDCCKYAVWVIDTSSIGTKEETARERSCMSCISCTICVYTVTNSQHVCVHSCRRLVCSFSFSHTQHGADVTIANNRGDTPLHAAAK